MRLSHYAIDSLLSTTYRLENIDPEELSHMEKLILEKAIEFDKERQA